MTDRPQISDEQLEQLAQVPVTELVELNVRIRWSLYTAGLEDARSAWEALVADELLAVHGIGPASVREFEALFRDHLDALVARADLEAWNAQWRAEVEAKRARRRKARAHAAGESSGLNPASRMIRFRRR